jgi:hypothetical protein
MASSSVARGRSARRPRARRVEPVALGVRVGGGVGRGAEPWQDPPQLAAGHPVADRFVTRPGNPGEGLDERLVGDVDHRVARAVEDECAAVGGGTGELPDQSGLAAARFTAQQRHPTAGVRIRGKQLTEDGELGPPAGERQARSVAQGAGKRVPGGGRHRFVAFGG